MQIHMAVDDAPTQSGEKLESGARATGEGVSSPAPALVFEQKGDSSAVANSCYKNEVNRREETVPISLVPHLDICCLQQWTTNAQAQSYWPGPRL